jgi:hypothetical protein
MEEKGLLAVKITCQETEIQVMFFNHVYELHVNCGSSSSHRLLKMRDEDKIGDILFFFLSGAMQYSETQCDMIQLYLHFYNDDTKTLDPSPIYRENVIRDASWNDNYDAVKTMIAKAVRKWIHLLCFVF